MSDKTSAEIFSNIFDMLAENPTEENKKLAERIWSITGNYDFHPCQMCSDDALLVLNLAKEDCDCDEGGNHNSKILYLGLHYEYSQKDS